MSNSNISIATDIVLERSNNGRPEILLIERKNPPFKTHWALPGGFVEEDEEIASAAVRELMEETDIKLGRDLLQFIDYFDAPDRDPRGRIVSMAFGHVLQAPAEVSGNSDAARAQWFSMDELPELAFDHRTIIARWEERPKS